jgi:hypothetical protein
MRRFTIVFAILLITSVAAHGQSCPPAGTAKSDAGKALNRLKNRDNAPSASQIDADVSLASILAPGDDVDRFDEQKGAKIVGFVIDVKPGGKKTCNCEATGEPHKDTHIELTLLDDDHCDRKLHVSRPYSNKSHTAQEYGVAAVVAWMARAMSWVGATTQTAAHPRPGEIP